MIAAGTIPGIRFLYLYSVGQRVGHVQSLILAAILLIVGFQVMLIGLLADLLSSNRKLLEDVVYRVRNLELGGAGPNADLEYRQEQIWEPREPRVKAVRTSR